MKKNELPIYRYKGQEVLLCYVDEVNGIEPIYEEMGKGVYLVTDELIDYLEEHDMRGCLTSDDCYSEYTEPEEIICTDILNPENQQCMIVDWARVSYAVLWDIDTLEGLAHYINNLEQNEFDPYPHVDDIIEKNGWELPDLSNESHIARDGNRLLYLDEMGYATIKENYFGQWYIMMKRGDSESYVATTDDVKVGGWHDASPENFGFPTEEEAKRVMAELEAYCQENDIDCTFYSCQENV